MRCDVSFLVGPESQTKCTCLRDGCRNLTLCKIVKLLRNPPFELHFRFLCLLLLFKCFFGFGFCHLYRFLGSGKSKKTQRSSYEYNQPARKKKMQPWRAKVWKYVLCERDIYLNSDRYLIRFSDNAAFPSRRVFFLVTVWFVPLIYVKVAVHLILRVRVVSMILIVSRFLERVKNRNISNINIHKYKL